MTKAVEPEIPDVIKEAILSRSPSPSAVDLVKQALGLRTIDAELLELAYDSALDVAGVRDGSGRRTLEFVASGLSVVIEVHGLELAGQITPAVTGTVNARGAVLRTGAGAQAELASGRFRVEVDESGPVLLTLDFDGRRTQLPVFVVG